ncbi:hypothetical protein UT300009_09810 [Paraclostridium bifermentans]
MAEATNSKTLLTPKGTLFFKKYIINIYINDIYAISFRLISLITTPMEQNITKASGIPIKIIFEILILITPCTSLYLSAFFYIYLHFHINISIIFLLQFKYKL